MTKDTQTYNDALYAALPNNLLLTSIFSGGNTTHLMRWIIEYRSYLESIAKDLKVKIYAFDDNSAVKVVDGKVEVITEREYGEFN